MAEVNAQQPIELTLKTGEVIKAPNYEEALKIAVSMTENTKEVYHQEKAAREKLEQQVNTLSGQVQQLQRPAPPASNNGFSDQRYWQLYNQPGDGPLQAANYLDACRFGIQDPASVPKYFQQIAQDVSTTRQEALAAQFLQQHAEDFPSTPESARSLRVQFEQLTGQGYPATLDTLNMAYGQAVDNGSIKPLEKKTPTRDEPNPSLSGSGGREIAEDEMAKIEKMDDATLKAYLQSKGFAV